MQMNKAMSKIWMVWIERLISFQTAKKFCRPINVRATVDGGEVVGIKADQHAFHLFQKPVKQ